MPKPKPDQVVRHELVLGRAEREQLDTLIGGMTVRNVGTPAVALLSDVSALLALAALLEALGLIDLAGLAKKAGGAGSAWIQAVIGGAFATLTQAVDDFEARAQAAYEQALADAAALVPDILPGGEPFTPGTEYIPRAPTVVKESLSALEKGWAWIQIQKQQAEEAIYGGINLA